MIFENSGLYIDSDFEIRIIRETEEDIDIIIFLEDRTVNLYLEDLPDYLLSRFQFPVVKNVIIRFCKSEHNNICTVHLLKSIDLNSAIVNFEIDYSNYYITLNKGEYFTEMRISKRELI